MSSSGEVLGYQELSILFNQLKQPGFAYDLIKSLQPWKSLLKQHENSMNACSALTTETQTLKKVQTLDTCPLQQWQATEDPGLHFWKNVTSLFIRQKPPENGDFFNMG